MTLDRLSNFFPKQTIYQPGSAQGNGQLGREKQPAAQKAAVHTNTPTVTYFDPLGRVFLCVADNGEYGKYQTTFFSIFKTTNCKSSTPKVESYAI